MKLIGWVLRGARYKDEILEVGDLAIHGEEAFPEEEFATRSDGAFAMAGIDKGGTGGASEPESDAESPAAAVPRPGRTGRKELKQ